MNKKITKDQLIKECTLQVLSELLPGNSNLQSCIEQVISNTIKWNKGNLETIQQPVLLNEAIIDPKEVVISTQPEPEKNTDPAIRPVAVGNPVSSGDRDKMKAAHVGPGVKSYNWSDPFAGTSWGVKKG